MTMMRGDDFDMQIDITEALREGLGKRAAPSIKLVPVDANGKRVPKTRLAFDSVELHVK